MRNMEFQVPDMSMAPSDIMLSMDSMTGLGGEHTPLMATDFMLGDKAGATLPHFGREPQDEVSMGLPHFSTQWDVDRGSMTADLGLSRQACKPQALQPSTTLLPGTFAAPPVSLAPPVPSGTTLPVSCSLTAAPYPLQVAIVPLAAGSKPPVLGSSLDLDWGSRSSSLDQAPQLQYSMTQVRCAEPSLMSGWACWSMCSICPCLDLPCPCCHWRLRRYSWSGHVHCVS